MSADVGGATITTETAGTLRVYERDGPRVQVALVARVTRPADVRAGRPLRRRPRRLDRCAQRGRRASAGASSPTRTHASPSRCHRCCWPSGAGSPAATPSPTAPPCAPTTRCRVAYNSDARRPEGRDRHQRARARRRQATRTPTSPTSRTTSLANDVGPQYDAGISAVFQSLELTPSVGHRSCRRLHAPQRRGRPRREERALRRRRLRRRAAGQASAPTAASTRSPTRRCCALVTEPTLRSAGAPAIPAARSTQPFDRLIARPKRPLVMRIDIDGDSFTATDTVGAALSAFEAQPWLAARERADAEGPPPAPTRCGWLAGRSTPDAPKGFWKTVAKSRSYAAAYYAAIGAGDPRRRDRRAAVTRRRELGMGGSGRHVGGRAARARVRRASLATTAPVLDGISHEGPVRSPCPERPVSVPITIVNDSENTLDVLVAVSSQRRRRGVDGEASRRRCRPRRPTSRFPVDMQTSLSGQAHRRGERGRARRSTRKTVTVSASYLDRLVLGGAVIVALLGMLVFIVRRTRASEARSADSGSTGRIH